MIEGVFCDGFLISVHLSVTKYQSLKEATGMNCIFVHANAKHVKLPEGRINVMGIFSRVFELSKKNDGKIHT